MTVRVRSGASQPTRQQRSSPHKQPTDSLPPRRALAPLLSDLRAMQLAGLAGLVGGALSMACGEYISVSSQKDAEEVGAAGGGVRERGHSGAAACCTALEQSYQWGGCKLQVPRFG
jgi:hypothetical protein